MGVCAAILVNADQAFVQAKFAQKFDALMLAGLLT